MSKSKRKKKLMKKVFYTLCLATSVLFRSCGQERGTTTEVHDSNVDEVVNPAHLHQYDRPGTASSSTTSITDGTTSNTTGARQPKQNASAVDIVYAYYTKNDPAKFYRSENYRYSATRRLSGEAARGNSAQETKPGTTIMLQSTTADGQGRKPAVTNKASEQNNKTTKKDNQKTRLTPEQ